MQLIDFSRALRRPTRARSVTAQALMAARTVLLAFAAVLAPVSQAEFIIPVIPLSVQQNVKPLVMIVAAKDHRLFYEAYNDASDVDGDGVIDIRFKPSIKYLGLFNSDVCYTHNGLQNNSGLFTPSSATAGVARTCADKWSGNWLNYISTSRIDALRVVLYGGMREIDSTTSTVLRRAYIPQDAHAWAKEYTSVAVDGYDIADYTPIALPPFGKRHFFGSLTANSTQDCATLSNCSDMPPWLSVVQNATSRVWQWASTERPVMTVASGSARRNYTVRVAACTAAFSGGCKLYPNGQSKPVGLLHEYGENDAMLFGLLTGSYDNNMSGGRLRKVISSFKDEVTAATGQFVAGARIVESFNALRIRNYNNGRKDQVYKGGWPSDSEPSAGVFPDWGNPMGEMMYESLRYFAGKGAPSAAYMGATTIDTAVGLVQEPWDDPYGKSSKAKAPICARGNLLVISDTNVSYDSDDLPGVYSAFVGAYSGDDIPGFSAAEEATTISNNEPEVAGRRFIGQSQSAFDSAPTPKSVQSLASIRGIAPEEPTKRGSYYSASAAYFGKRSDLRPGLDGRQSVDTFVVALASPQPRIEVPMAAGKNITLVPFAKTVAGFDVSAAKGRFQPTNQVVDFYFEELSNAGDAPRRLDINEGRYQARFQISYEDIEQGGDHEMDVVVSYTVAVNANNTVTVTVKPTYQSGGPKHRIGYIISGTSADGVYLEVQDESETTLPYFLNTPPNRLPGYCDASPVPADCARLPYLGAAGSGNQAVRSFSPGTEQSASFLRDPLWYAAKWGGFIDRNSNGKPDLVEEWDLDGPNGKPDGMPDNYLLVQNPTKLKQSLKKALDNIASRTSSASSVSANSTSISDTSALYQAVFNTQRWSGDLIAYPATAAGAGSTPAWAASEKLPTWSDRKLFMRTSTGTTLRMSSYASLSAADQSAFGTPRVFDYLRGQRAQEMQNGGTLRDRSSALGDIIHGSPFYDRNTAVVYAGANDGLLHAFKAATGVEIFGFMPRAVVDRVKNLASVAYAHQYLIDGDVVVSDRTGDFKKSFLYALMGRGGKGLFSLDVTAPEDPTAAGLFLWEYTPQGSADASGDADLGYMLGRPVVVRLNNGKLGVLVGNGYNSTNEKAVLYIFIVDANGALLGVRKLDAGDAGNNGLAGPAESDVNNDGKTDFVYAGDMKGNVWKFDLSAADPANWRVSNEAKPLFQAQDANGLAQPITAPLFLARSDRTDDPNRGKLFVFFGTGSYFKAGDAGNTDTQSWYGIVDEPWYTTSTTPGVVNRGRPSLKARNIVAPSANSSRSSRAFAKKIAHDMDGKKGWFIDFATPAGERIVTRSKVVNFGVPGLLASSMIPVADDPCVPGGRGYLNVIDPFSGAALDIGILDIDGNGKFDDKLDDNFVSSIDLGVGLPTEPLTMSVPGGNVISLGGSGDDDKLIKSMLARGAARYARRIAWREILRD